MRELSPTPSIEVAIGGQIRVYHVFVTTAAPTLDGPSTMTLHASTLSDVCGFARQYVVNGERRSFVLLRPIGDVNAQERIRELVLQAYAAYEDSAMNDASSPATISGCPFGAPSSIGIA